MPKECVVYAKNGSITNVWRGKCTKISWHQTNSVAEKRRARGIALIMGTQAAICIKRISMSPAYANNMTGRNPTQKLNSPIVHKHERQSHNFLQRKFMPQPSNIRFSAMTNAGDFLHEMANKYEKLSKSDSVLSNIILLHVLHLMSKENSVCVHCKHTTPSKRDV